MVCEILRIADMLEAGTWKERGSSRYRYGVWTALERRVVRWTGSRWATLWMAVMVAYQNAANLRL